MILVMNQSAPSLETREEVMFFDTDCGGVVHNIAYLRMIETCRTRLAASMGMNLSEMMESVLDLAHLGDWYGSLAEHTLAGAIARSAACGIVLLAITAGLNRIGFRLKL